MRILRERRNGFSHVLRGGQCVRRSVPSGPRCDRGLACQPSSNSCRPCGASRRFHCRGRHASLRMRSRRMSSSSGSEGAHGTAPRRIRRAASARRGGQACPCRSRRPARERRRRIRCAGRGSGCAASGRSRSPCAGEGETAVDLPTPVEPTTAKCFDSIEGIWIAASIVSSWVSLPITAVSLWCVS